MLYEKIAAVSISICLALMLVASAVFGANRSAPIVINHLCTDLAAISTDAIQTAQNVCKWHYARLSHGYQIMEGFGIIEAADPFYAAIWPKSGGWLPVEPGTLCIYTDPVGPTSYWQGSGIDITRSILNGTPALNISAMSWCSELNNASAS